MSAAIFIHSLYVELISSRLSWRNTGSRGASCTASISFRGLLTRRAWVRWPPGAERGESRQSHRRTAARATATAGRRASVRPVQNAVIQSSASSAVPFARGWQDESALHARRCRSRAAVHRACAALSIAQCAAFVLCFAERPRRFSAPASRFHPAFFPCAALPRAHHVPWRGVGVGCVERALAPALFVDDRLPPLAPRLKVRVDLHGLSVLKKKITERNRMF